MRLFYLVILLTLGSCAGNGNSRKMNVVFILADDLGWSDIGCYGSEFYETPNIDRLASESARFTNAYSACQVCSPTRASILTGQYPARLRLTDWLPGRRNFPFQKFKNAETRQHLPYNEKTLPWVLKENGYKTAIIGKWHLGEDSVSTLQQGFDIQIPQWNKGWPRGSYFSPYGMDGLEGGPDGEYLTDRLTDEAIKFIEENKEQPFFLYLSHFAVHDPIQGRKDLVSKYEQKLNGMPKQKGPPFILEMNPDSPDIYSRVQLNSFLADSSYQGFSLLPNQTIKIKQFQDNIEFAGMVESLDEGVGRVMDKLKELGLDKNTLVIFFSDNGGMSAANFGNPTRKIVPENLDRAFSTSNLPLRAGKGWLYEGGIRVPLIIRKPGKTGSGSVSHVPVMSTDFYPTIMDMAGILPLQNGNNGIDGMSLVPVLKNQKKEMASLENRALFWHFPHYSNHGLQSPGGAIRFGNYKLLEYFENNTVQLFDLEKDPGEQNDISESQPQKTSELRDMLHKWRREVNADMMVPNPDYTHAE